MIPEIHFMQNIMSENTLVLIARTGKKVKQHGKPTVLIMKVSKGDKSGKQYGKLTVLIIKVSKGDKSGNNMEQYGYNKSQYGR